MKNFLNTNTKLKKDNIFKFSLPVKRTCIGAGKCKEFCYATKGMYRKHANKIGKAHDRNFEFSKSKSFVSSIVDEIYNRKIKIVRIHDTGDFYSQKYLDKWFSIALLLPDTRFYAYTKSLKLDFSLFTMLPNTKIIQSFGGKHDWKISKSRPHGMIFENLLELHAFGYVDCSKSDLVALETKNPNIGLIHH